MNKKIEFFEQTSGPYGQLVTYEVDLDRLSPLARRLAQGIYTTDKRDDFSFVFVEDTVPAYQRYAENKYNILDGAATMEDRIQALRKRYGDMLDDPQVMSYDWPQKKKDESPEDYLERCAKDIESNGWAIVQTTIEKPSEIRELRRRLDMTQAAFGELCGGIPVNTIRDWEGKRTTPPEWVVNLIRWRVEAEQASAANKRTAS